MKCSHVNGYILVDMTAMLEYAVAMYIETVPNRGSPPAILLRESYREGKRVRKRTLLNLSNWAPEHVEGLRGVLKGGVVIPAGQEALSVERSLPHGHVAAVLGTARAIGLDRLLGPEKTREPNRPRDLVMAMVVSRVLAPASKLATAKALDPATAASSLGVEVDLGEVDEDELYAALDWLYERQGAIEAKLAKRHLKGGTLVLYDVSSSYVEGRCCSLAKRGYNRDGKKGKAQIVYGLLCAADGCPVAIEVFDGNTGDPATVADQVAKLKQRFALEHVVLVGDRGMITQARIEETLRPAGLDWITALRAPALQGLVGGGFLQMSLFDDRDMAAVTSPEFPGERLIVCRNAALAKERARKREDLLKATERDLARIAAAVARNTKPLRGAAEIGVAVGALVDKHKMAKHIELTISDTRFTYRRKTNQISDEAALDGLYAVRTSLPKETLEDAAAVKAYKSLSMVERAFRCLKTVDLHVRPIHHWLEERVRAHVFLCMLAYYVEWNMRGRLAPMLYDDDDKAAAEAERESPVAKAQRSPAALAKSATGRTPDGAPVHSFQSLLADLATLTRNTIVTAIAPLRPFTILARPTPIQQKALDLLDIRIACTQ
jgi:Transposase DDE domain